MNNNMKMKNKVFHISIFCIIIMTIISFSNTVLAVQNYTLQERNTMAEEAFQQWIETYKSEEIPENRKITDYNLQSVRVGEIEENEFLATIEFTVTPVSIENTEWNYGEPEIGLWEGHEVIWYVKTNICYIRIKVENGDYQVEYIGETPEGYDEFAKRFEEYKKTHSQEEVENVQIQGEETDNQLANQEIEKMSNGIVIGCSVVLLIVICLVGVKVIKYRKNNRMIKK